MKSLNTHFDQDHLDIYRHDEINLEKYVKDINKNLKKHGVTLPNKR